MVRMRVMSWLFCVFLFLIIIILIFKKVFPYFSSNLSLSFFLYVALFFLSFNFNVIRHGVMAAFVWNACHYWLESKKVSAIFLLVLGALFHVLSLTFLLIIPICCSSKRYPIYIYILVLIFISVDRINENLMNLFFL